MIDRNHPAVNHAVVAMLGRVLNRDTAHRMLNAALPHLTADDLRDTPAGRELMAEAWDECADKLLALNGGDDRDYTAGYLKYALNPYKETPNE